MIPHVTFSDADKVSIYGHLNGDPTPLFIEKCWASEYEARLTDLSFYMGEKWHLVIRKQVTPQQRAGYVQQRRKRTTPNETE